MRPSVPLVSRLPDGRRELVIAALAYLAYEAARALATGERGPALATGRDLLRLERLVGLDVEAGLNAMLGTLPVLALACCYFYAVCHYLVTPTVFVWLFRRHRAWFGRARTTVLAATVVGFFGYWLLPTAPPRMLPGFEDTMVNWAAFGWWAGSGGVPDAMEGLSNPYAAMPSLHVGWAVWCGWYVARVARRPVVRALGVAYPLVTTFVVVATANHYVVDAVAGALVIALGGGVAVLLERVHRLLVRRRPAVPLPAGRVPVPAQPSGRVARPRLGHATTGPREPGRDDAA